MDRAVQDSGFSSLDESSESPTNSIRTPTGPHSVWLSGAFWAICDQGLWSLTNFAFSLYLVRALGPHGFGVYSVVFSVLLVVNSVQNSLLLEPMSVISAAEAAKGEKIWKEGVARIQTRLAVFGGVALGVAAAVAWALGFEFASALAALAAGFPFLAAVAFRRRVAYMENVPSLSVRAGVVNLTAVFFAAAVCRWFGVLTSASAFLILGLASVPSLLSISKLDSFRWHASGQSSTDLSENWSALWRYGRWSGASALSGWMGSVLYPPLLAATSGYEVAGLYRSMEYLFLPANQALTAVCVFSLPTLSSKFSAIGLRASRRTCITYVTILVGSSLVYSALAFVSFGPIARMAWGPEYAKATWMVPFLGCILVLRALGDAGIGLILRADRRPNAIFIAWAASAAVIASVGYPLCRAYGIAGLLYGSCAASIIQVGIYLWFLLREIRNPDSFRRLPQTPAGTAVNPGGKW